MLNPLVKIVFGAEGYVAIILLVSITGINLSPMFLITYKLLLKKSPQKR
jgi:hypothetical protein